MRRMEHAHRGGGCRRTAGHGDFPPRQRARPRARGPQGHHTRGAALLDRHRRARPRLRRRHRAGVGTAHRRRAGHRQIDAATTARRNVGARGRRAVYFSGEEAAAQVRLRAERLGLSDAPVALACETSLCSHPRDARGGTAARSHRRQFHPDPMGRGHRGGARNRQPSARRGAGADPPCQDGRQRPAARRPCDEGRSDRRPESDRAHGRYRIVLRRRPRAHLSHSARGEEPLRRHRRDRRIRNGVGRTARGRQPIRIVSR